MAKKKTINIFNQNKSVSSDVLDIIFDPGIRSKNKTLEDYFTVNKLVVDPDQLTQLAKLVETQIYNTVYYLAHLRFYIMNLSDQWGDAGKQQVLVSFCRNLLTLSPLSRLTFEDMMRFHEIVEKNIMDLGIKSIPLDQAVSHYKTSCFQLLGKRFELYQAVEMSKLLHFCGSKKWLQGRNQGEWPSFIFGEGKAIHKAEYEIVFLTKEEIRTPNNIMAMAAVVGATDVFVREESLEIIFYQKWLHMFNEPEELLRKSKENIYKNIALAIKQQCLKCYNVSSAEELIKIEKKFVKDMRETIYYHEIGHGLVQNYLLPAETVAVGEATQFYGETIFTAMSEFLADFTPKHKGLKGPIRNILEISKKDKDRAERMYYMYFSDTFFLDTQDEYMYLYSDLMSLILMKYIKKDHHIDFVKLEEDLRFRPKGSHENPSLFERVLDLFVNDTDYIRTHVKKAKYKLSKERDFEYVREIRTAKARQLNPIIDINSYEFLAPFWLNMIAFVDRLTDSNKVLRKYIEKQKGIILKKIMIASCGRKKAEAYQFNHRRYIVDRMKELEFFVINV
ncbi:hypothetical protein ACFL96_01745 [Thermoproteota archaeon]